MKINYFIFTFALFALNAFAASAPSSSCAVSVSQNLRTSWTTNGVLSYLYDLTVTNTGTLPASINIVATADQTIVIAQTWNIVTLASTDATEAILNIFDAGSLSTSHIYLINVGDSYTGAGYVTTGSQTNITGLAFCPSSTTTTTAASTGSAAASTSTGSSVSTSTGASSSCGVSIAQTVVSTWVTGAQVTVIVSNTGSSPITSLSMRLSSLPSQFWSVNQLSDGTFGFPSYVTTLAVGSSFTWGYVLDGTTSKLGITILVPSSCGASSSSSTSATTSSIPSTTGSTSSTTTSTTTGSSSGCSATVSQNLRTSWNASGVLSNLYDLTVTNTGTLPASVRFSVLAQHESAISFTQTWNLESIEGSSEESSQHENRGIFKIFNAGSTTSVFLIDAGASYTNAGYVSTGLHPQTEITGHHAFCPSS